MTDTSKAKHWVYTGSIIDMLQRSNVCSFEREGDKVVVKSEHDLVMLYPEMLLHLAFELGEMANEIMDMKDTEKSKITVDRQTFLDMIEAITALLIKCPVEREDQVEAIKKGIKALKKAEEENETTSH